MTRIFTDEFICGHLCNLWMISSSCLCAFVVFLIAPTAFGCPFCNAVKPTLAQLQDSAVVTILCEATDQPTEHGDKAQSFKVLRALEGKERIASESVRIKPDVPVKSGSLVLLTGEGAAEVPLAELTWTATPLDEVAASYVAREPGLRESSAKRLAFFAKYLEHANPLLAEDAYLEFGHATFDQTAEAANSLPSKKLRGWLVDPTVPPARKGFYALALGFAKDGDDRRLNRELLHEQIMAPANDFRAGFDGILAGYLLLAGKPGLELIELRYLANPKAADGDVRHALKAVRFYHDYGKEIESAQLAAAEVRVLDRPEFAAEAITDLARWQDWSIVSQVAGDYELKAYSDSTTRRAIVAYLKFCPKPEATEQLDRLRRVDPQGVADAEKYLSVFSGGK